MPHIKGNPVKPPPDLGLRGLALLDKIIEIIEAHPELHDQHVWAKVSSFPGLTRGWDLNRDGDTVPETCGTTLCVAGWAAHLCGAQLEYRVSGWTRLVLTADYATMDGSFLRIDTLARQLLELDADFAEELFHDNNTLNSIKSLRDEFAERVTA